MRQKMQQQQQQQQLPQQQQQQQQYQGQQSQQRSQYPVISIDEFEQFMSSRQQQQQHQQSTHSSIAKEYTVISPPAAGFQFQSEKQPYQAQGQSHHYPSNLTHTKHNTLVTLNALKAKNKNLFTIEDLGQEDHVPSKNNLQGKQQYQHQQSSMNSNTGGGSRSYQSNQSNKQVSCYSNNRQTQSKTNSWNNNNNNYSNKAQKLQQQSQVASNKDGITIKGQNQRQSQPKSQTSQNNLWYGQSDRDKENDDPQIISAQPRDQTAVVKSQSQYLHRNTKSCHDVAIPEYSFNPMLSKKSMKMAENMEDAYVRLSVSSLLKKQANIQAMRDNIEGQCKFKPTVNSNYKMNKKMEQIEGKQNNQENQKVNSYGDSEGVDEEDEMISSILTDSLEIDQDASFDRVQGEDNYQQGSHDNRNTFQSAFFRDSQHDSERQLANDQQIKQISVSSLEENNSTKRMQSENDNNINTQQQQPQHRWERLYKQHEVILAKRAIEAARSKEAIDDAELTFKPNLKPTKSTCRQSQQIGQDDNNDEINNRHQSSQTMDIAQRSEIWLNKKQAKIDTAVAEAQVNALKHCTFAPITISNSHKQQQSQVHQQQIRTNTNRQALGRIHEEGEQGIGFTDRDCQNGNEQYGEENNSQGENRDQQQHYQSKQRIMSNGTLPFQSISNTDNTNYQSTAQFSSNSPSSQLSSARDTLEYITDFNRRGLEQYFQRVEAAKNKRLLKQQQSQVSLTSGIASKRITVPKEFSFMKQNRQHSQDGHLSQRGNAQVSVGIQQQQPKQKGYQQQMMKIRSVSCNQLQTLHKQLQNLRM